MKCEMRNLTHENIPNLTKMKPYSYVKLSEEEYNLLDNAIEQLEFTSRTDYFTASAHVLIYGRSPQEWNTALHTLWQKNELMKKTFLDTVHEKAFRIIAMNGTGALISSGIIEDVKLELLSKCGMIPEDCELRDWLKIYKNLHRDELALYRAKIISDRFGGDND